MPPQPQIGRHVYIASTAYVAGDVVLGDHGTIMHHVVIRGDIARIVVGARVNVQDGSILHTPAGVDLVIGDDVGIGHRAVVHCSAVGRRTLIGIGAVVLDGCDIGAECIVAAGAVVAPHTQVPAGSVVMGVPAKVVRLVKKDDLAYIDSVVASYVRLGPRHAAGEFPNVLDRETDVLHADDLATSLSENGEDHSLGDPAQGGLSLAEVERLHIVSTLEMAGGNRERAAGLLKIGSRTLYRKLKDYGIR